jgi:hypothetical protein
VRSDGSIVAGLASPATFSTLRFGRWKLAGGLPTFVTGDFNGDGRADVAVFFRHNGSWVVGRSNGSALQARLYGVWPLGLDGYRYHGERIAYAPGSPWLVDFARSFIDAQAPTQLAQMTFNSPSRYVTFVENFKDVVKSWVKEADLAGVRSDQGLKAFLGQHLAVHFNAVRPVLARAYPRRTDRVYRMLMAMNLATGSVRYATTYSNGRSLYRTMHLTTGDCSELTDITVGLLRAEGFPARPLGIVLSYQSAAGFVGATHQVAYVPGMWLDAETNVALGASLPQIGSIAGPARLQWLLDRHLVFGFYNWYLHPDVRQEQLNRGLDGGAIVYYYRYYLGGIGLGGSRLSFPHR